MNSRHHHRLVAGLVSLAGLASGVILVAAGTSRSAMASDDKVFAPQACVPIVDDDRSFAIYSVAEIMQDQGGEYQLFICPVIRDEVTGDLDDVWVRLGNEESEDDTPPICCAHAVSIDGTLQNFECETAPDTEGRLSLHLALGELDEFDHGHYAVTCELGLSDSIISIRTSEFD